MWGSSGSSTWARPSNRVQAVPWGARVMATGRSGFPWLKQSSQTGRVTTAKRRRYLPARLISKPDLQRQEIFGMYTQAQAAAVFGQVGLCCGEEEVAVAGVGGSHPEWIRPRPRRAGSPGAEDTGPVRRPGR